MLHNCIRNINEISSLLEKMEDKQYAFHTKNLNSSIGQHVRHILEFYLCLLKGFKQGRVCYDNRDRNPVIEVSTEKAIEVIDSLKTELDSIDLNKETVLLGNFNSESNAQEIISTSVKRELAYCLEHSIHHQALIKVGLSEQNLSHLISNDFGKAPATIRHEKECAQ